MKHARQQRMRLQTKFVEVSCSRIQDCISIQKVHQVQITLHLFHKERVHPGAPSLCLQHNQGTKDTSDEASAVDGVHTGGTSGAGFSSSRCERRDEARDLVQRSRGSKSAGGGRVIIVVLVLIVVVIGTGLCRSSGSSGSSSLAGTSSAGLGFADDFGWDINVGGLADLGRECDG